MHSKQGGAEGQEVGTEKFIRKLLLLLDIFIYIVVMLAALYQRALYHIK